MIILLKQMRSVRSLLMTLKAVALITQQITQYISMTSILPNTSETEPTPSGS